MLDLDDTLFLERDYVRSGFQAVGEWVGDRFAIFDFGPRAFRKFVEGFRGNIFDIVLDECGCRSGAEDIAAMVSVYRLHHPTISPLPDAVELLTCCKDRFEMALISDGFPEAQRRKLKALQIEDYFATTILTGERPNWGKPSPHAFLHVEQGLGRAGKQFWYVADNPLKDFQAPRQLGWTTVRIRREQGIYSHLEATEQGKPHCEITDLRELQQVLATV